MQISALRLLGAVSEASGLNSLGFLTHIALGTLGIIYTYGFKGMLYTHGLLLSLLMPLVYFCVLYKFRRKYTKHLYTLSVCVIVCSILRKLYKTLLPLTSMW